MVGGLKLDFMSFLLKRENFLDDGQNELGVMEVVSLLGG